MILGQQTVNNHANSKRKKNKHKTQAIQPIKIAVKNAIFRAKPKTPIDRIKEIIINHCKNTVPGNKIVKLYEEGYWISKQRAYYRVSGGPIMVTLHSKTLLSSTKPAEKPSTGFLERSATKREEEGESIKIDEINQRSNLREKEGLILIPLSCFWRRRLAWDEAIKRERERESWGLCEIVNV